MTERTKKEDKQRTVKSERKKDIHDKRDTTIQGAARL